MKGFMKTGMVLAAMCLFLTGCGSVAQLTEEEEQVIVAYVSGAVAKANKYQVQGLTYPKEKEGLPEESGAENEDREGTSTKDTKPGQENVQPGEQGNGDTSDVRTTTLTEALGLSGVQAEYQEYQVSGNYLEGDYFALNSRPGRTYVILKIRLRNTAEQPVDCNFLEKNMNCSLLVNGEKAGDAMSTILLNDFMSYIGTLEPAAETDTVVIFEVPEAMAENIQGLSLELEADGTLNHINLQ